MNRPTPSQARRQRLTKASAQRATARRRADFYRNELMGWVLVTMGAALALAVVVASGLGAAL